MDEVVFTAEEMASLGTASGIDAPAPEPEPVAAVVTAPEPVLEPEAVLEPEPAAAAADTDDDGFTVDELRAEIRAALAESDPFADTPAEPTAEDVERKKLADENASLKAKIAEQESKADEAQARAETKRLEHSIDSTIGKLKMTDVEVESTTKYLLANPDLGAAVMTGSMTWEEAAMRRHPGIGERARTAQTTPSSGGSGADGVLEAPAANGNGAPSKFKHTPSPGDYGDISRHLLASGEAASLGRYT